MKCSELWLRQWVNPDMSRDALSHLLTMAGLEVEACLPVADKFSGVVIGEIIKIDKHPEADRLHLCEVNIAGVMPLSIVCGAKNVRVGMKVPVAKIGASLPNEVTIKSTTIRGVPSEGMLCSAKELGLVEESEGLFELDMLAPLGDDIRDYLKLDDYTLDISITPNRGDCLSVKGLAREISALTKASLNEITIPAIEPVNKDSIPVSIEESKGCPHYVGRVIRQVKADAKTPAWMEACLKRSGIRCIHLIVDVTNYVMLELGQPMHAFDLDTIQQGIKVRQSKQGEKIVLLDGSEQQLNDQTLIIADHEKPLAIAGVMGGLNSSVTLLTKDIFLESAYFLPETIAKQRQYYQINSESAYRFERHVDPTIQRQAIERATQLILEIAGGEPGVIIDQMNPEFSVSSSAIELSSMKVKEILGVILSREEINAIFNALKFPYKDVNIKNPLVEHEEETVWYVSVPPYRSDIALYEDLIEEIARLYGYDNIPTHSLKADLMVQQTNEPIQGLDIFRQALSNQGYHEIISYSFVDKKLQSLLNPEITPRNLINPISADMSVMRTNLWSGLMATLLYNKSRQQHRVRLFEIGTCFIQDKDLLLQPTQLAGLITGFSHQEQWGVPPRPVDFYDLKGNVETLLNLTNPSMAINFKSEAHRALHPGQSAAIYAKNQRIGMLGALHPHVLQALDVADNVFVFELNLDGLVHDDTKRFQEISKFPEIRRDIAILVNQTIPAEVIQDTIRGSAGNWLKDIFVFDVYMGKGIAPGLKSIALALIFQHPTRTLVDSEATELLERVMEVLKEQLGASLRS